MRAQPDARLYDNCLLVSPAGIVMCRMSRRKCNWYTSRGLAEVVGDQPHTIRLTFEPAGLGAHDDEFYLRARPNICAVCGTDKMLTRHHCVPYCIRRRFPPHLKEHASHDIVPMCRLCHDVYEDVAKDKKHALTSRYVTDEFRARRAAFGYASTVLRHGDKIPAHKREILEAEINRVYGAEGNEALRKLVRETRRPGDSELWDRVVADLDIPACIVEWRQHFITTMKPKYLPEGWSVDGRIGVDGPVVQ